MSDFIALLPLRAGSKGIPKKNIREIAGVPLFVWAASAALNAGIRLVVSTESEEIESMVSRWIPNAEILKRPAELATDEASTESVIHHFLEHYDGENVILLQATSPLTTKRHVKEAIAKYRDGSCKPLVSGTLQHKFIWDRNGWPINYNAHKRPRRQEWEGCFVENGAVYIFSRKDFMRSNSRCSPPCTLYEMYGETSIEIDTLDEWRVIEGILKEKAIGPEEMETV